MNKYLTTNAKDVLKHKVGIVIPVYFPLGIDDSEAADLLRDTAYSYVDLLDDPRNVCLSVDGVEHGLDIATCISKDCGARLVSSQKNRGKLGGVRKGVQALWNDEKLTYFVEVDSDGDHFANELINLIRAAINVQDRCEDDVLVIGRRTSKHRPMGFLRGELEELADRVLLDALYYHAALSGQALSLEYATPIEEYPDFHSGFKLFSRGAAQATFLDDPKICGVGEDAYFRHGCEAVMTVEPLLSSARLVLVNRSTFNEQPVTTFGLLNRERMIADKIIWPCKRMHVPATFVDQWLTNHCARLILNTLVPQGKSELLQIRSLVLSAFGIENADAETMNWGPLFV